MAHLKNLIRILGNFLLFLSIFEHLKGTGGGRTLPSLTLNSEKLVDFRQIFESAVDSNSNSGTSLDGLDGCFFHLIEYEMQLLDYSSVTRPYIVNKGYLNGTSSNSQNTTKSLHERKVFSPVRKIPKSRETSCVINLFSFSFSLFKRIEDAPMDSYSQLKSWHVQQLFSKREYSPIDASAICYRFRFHTDIVFDEVPERVKLNLFLVDWDSSSNLKSKSNSQDLGSSWLRKNTGNEGVSNPVLGEYLAEKVSHKTKAPTFLLVSSEGFVKGELYYCPLCFDMPIAGFGFSCHVSENQWELGNSNCFSEMLRVYKKTVLFQRIPILFDFSFLLEVLQESSESVKIDPLFQSKEQFFSAVVAGSTPFHRKKPWPVGLDYAVAFSVLSALNLTTTATVIEGGAKGDWKKASFQNLDNSLIKRGPHLYLERDQDFIVGEKSYRLITSDAVHRLKSGLDIYVTPFQPAVWTTILVVLVTTAIAISGLLYGFSRWVKKEEMLREISVKNFCAVLLDTFYWNSRILLEQCDGEFPHISIAYITSKSKSEPQTEPEIRPASELGIGPKNKDTGDLMRSKVQVKEWTHICRLILGMWLLMSIIFTNGYKGTLKSEYAVKYPFKTDWQNTKDFLEKKFLFRTEPIEAQDFWAESQLANGGTNFSVYFMRSGLSCEKNPFSRLFAVNAFEWYGEDDYYYAPYKDYHAQIRTEKLFAQCKSACGDVFQNFTQSNCTHVQACMDLALNMILFHNTWLTCPQKLPEVIENISRNKKRPGSKSTAVLIVPDPDFPRVWDIFKRMRNRSDIVPFSHNKHVGSDDSFKYNVMYSIKPGLDRHYPNALEWRMRFLLTSGIYWHWERWDRQRFADWTWNDNKTLWEIEEQVEPFTALSFDESDVALVFRVWALCWFISLTSLLIEGFGGWWQNVTVADIRDWTRTKYVQIIRNSNKLHFSVLTKLRVATRKRCRTKVQTNSQ